MLRFGRPARRYWRGRGAGGAGRVAGRPGRVGGGPGGGAGRVGRLLGTFLWPERAYMCAE